MHAILRPKRNCGCSLEQAFFLILLWNVYARQAR